GRKSQSRDGRTDAAEAVGGDGEPCERIVLRRIEAERYDQRARRERLNGLFRNLKRLQVAVVTRSLGQGNVEIGAEPRPRAALVRKTPHEGIEEGRIGMDR